MWENVIENIASEIYKIENKIKEIEKKIDEIDKKCYGLDKRMDTLEVKMKPIYVPKPNTTTFSTNTDAIEDFLNNFPNAKTGQVYRIIW